MRNRASLTFSLLLIIGDAVAILAAYILAYALRVKFSAAPAYYSQVGVQEFLLSLLILLPFVIILFSLIGTYRSRPQKKIAQISRIFFGAGGAMLFMIMIHYFSIQPIFPSKLVPIYGFLFSIICLSLERGILYFARYLRHRKRIGLIDTIIIGDNRAAQDLVANIRRDQNYKIQSVVGQNKFATHKTFAGATRNFRPDLIIQVATREKPEIDTEILDFAQKNYIDFKFVPREINDLPDRIEMGLFMGDVPMMGVEPTALVGWGRVAKRIFDVMVAGIALLILSPFLLLIGLVNKLINGHVFFRHARLTRNNQTFRLIKFQTVCNELNGLEPADAFKKIGQPELIKKYRANGDFLPDDPRYGRWSKFLRRTSIDELPQLINVLKGDISLVGPRALAPDELEQSKQKHVILNVKSGITGLAQISGRRDLPWEQRRKLDVYYVQNWSFALDLQILFKTFLQVLTSRGAK